MMALMLPGAFCIYNVPLNVFNKLSCVSGPIGFIGFPCVWILTSVQICQVCVHCASSWVVSSSWQFVCLSVCPHNAQWCHWLPMPTAANAATGAQCCHWQPATRDKCWKDDIYWSTSKSGFTSPLIVFLKHGEVDFSKQFCSLIGKIRQIHFTIWTNTFYNLDKYILQFG